MKELIDELELLLFDWETGALDAEGVERVREILRSDANARDHFVQQQLLSVSLNLEGATGTVSEVGSTATDSSINKPQPKTNQLQPSKIRPAGSVGVAAMLIAVCIAWFAFLQLRNNSGNQFETAGSSGTLPTEEISHGVAVVTRLVDVQWGEGETQREVGDSISPGVLAIKSGYAQIEFLCGATVIIEGPAELNLKSATQASVNSGRLRAQVPPAARGFSLAVEGMQVVDLGTEFGLSVSDTGTNVQVFDGEVELQTSTTPKRLMVAGESLVRTSSGDYQVAEMTPEQFLDISQLESRVHNQQQRRYKRWQRWSAAVRNDNLLLAYYSFDQSGNWQRKLTNSSLPTNSELDGAIVGANRVPGRWEAKSGLEFRRPGDRVRVQIPGEFESLTFASWVKIDSLDRQFNSLFLTDHYDKGEPHWQILHTGQLYFSVRPSSSSEDGPRDFKALSPSFWTASLSGRWIHLATVYSVDAKTITHYLNGELLSEHSVPDEQMVPTRIGIASIGNWASPTQPDAGFAIRNLNGSMDELAIFRAALTTEQIHEMYVQSKP